MSEKDALACGVLVHVEFFTPADPEESHPEAPESNHGTQSLGGREWSGGQTHLSGKLLPCAIEHDAYAAASF